MHLIDGLWEECIGCEESTLLYCVASQETTNPLLDKFRVGYGSRNMEMSECPRRVKDNTICINS